MRPCFGSSASEWSVHRDGPSSVQIKLPRFCPGTHAGPRGDAGDPCGRGADTPTARATDGGGRRQRPAAPAPPPPPRELTWNGKVDIGRSGRRSGEGLQGCTGAGTPPTLAILAFRALQLEVPVFDVPTDACSTSPPAGSRKRPCPDGGQRRHRGRPGRLFRGRGHQGRRRSCGARRSRPSRSWSSGPHRPPPTTSA